ncbi:SRPBCC domain-containing protein [Parafilimonas terrae]|uniref:Activator of Hsp90 ATPase homolog 1-like protein n=1 Tax=Parafilimonas terrae TaxID=1465490 RepID=A0A1I5YLV5_9BACT|nr:SRPBCC domain-containing protein [Parafilimonas terrae]SFQ45176.1 Activator of Hsp90 ATPase homolog 1-like protein [Parafilimonas terrae]
MKTIAVAVLVEKPLDVVWEKWINPDAIKQWNIPFENWHCPGAINDVTDGGLFIFRMEKKDGSEGFDYKGKYNRIIPFEYIESIQHDGRKTIVEFQQIDDNTIIRESFEPEAQTPLDVQESFCQSVLNRFKQYAEQKR